MEQGGQLCGHLEARPGWAGGQPLSSQMLGLRLGPGSPSFKARGSLWASVLGSDSGLIACCQTVAPTLPGAGVGCRRELPFRDH